MAKAGKTGVTKGTPKNILFGAGTIHKGLKFDTTGKSWNFEDSIIGATTGGSKVSIVPEITKIEADGALVAAKGLSVKTGETATMEINFLELTKDIMKSALIAKEGTSAAEKYDLLESKANIEEGDYLENIAFVGTTLDGRNVIVIFDNALCTSGLSLESANKEGVAPAVTFEVHADLDSDLDTLPYHIYYPQVTATA